ncbi:MAG: phytanoyl-CoA dioxygenase family protein [Sphingomonas adhaesiva]|uniref:phytanoyl-CoA dioxygenase family protein n=1 Tax=Sphingomonas adhaesiva TaxID=28212 RepID=UPI002FF87166
MIDEEQPAAELLKRGFCILRGIAPVETMTALDRDLDAQFATTPYCDGDFYGRATKRLGGLLLRSRQAEALVQHPDVLALAEQVLLPWCDRVALNLTQAIEIHPGALAQYPHRDEDMWGGPKGAVEYLVNVMWPLVPFSPDNGATRLWPGSHRDRSVHGTEIDTVVPALDPGDALLFLGSTLHGGGENRTRQARRGIIVSYCLGWLKPFENQWLVYPPDVARTFDPELAALIGYVQHRPNLGNVEGRCPSELLWPTGGGLPAADALLPAQNEALAVHVAEQMAARAGLLGGWPPLAWL